MADADQKKKQVAKAGKVPAQDATVKPAYAGIVNLSFYHAAELTPLYPEDGAELELETADGKTLDCVELQKDGKNNYSIDLSKIKLSDLADPDEDTAARLEIACGTPLESSPRIVISGFAKPMQSGCSSYQTQRCLVGIPAGGTGTCTSIPIAMNQLEETYAVRLLAYDECISDYIYNPKAMIDEVKLQVRAVETTRQAAGSKKATLHGGSFSAITKRGYAEITGLIFGQSYEVYLSAPAGYICTNPPASQLCNTSGGSLLLKAPFQPCGGSPTRSVIFVQKAYPGMRMTSLNLENQQKNPDQNGVWNIPQPTGRVDFQSVGKVFSPPYINLDKDSPVVFVVGVGDEQVAQLSPGKRRFQHVDHKGEPFANRQLRLVSPGGHEEFVCTDPHGWFEAEEGSSASAADDDIGYASDFPCLTIATD